MLQHNIRALLLAIPVAGALVSTAAIAKDQGPLNVTCDRYQKSSQAWMDCAERAPAAAGPDVADAEHFYAGYWLAKNGRYEEALKHLRETRVRNARILTYIGFATRKLGRLDEAMEYYAEALRKDPENVIARSYLGEAYLAQDDLAAALSQLRRIEKACGRNCEAFTELASQIEDYRTAQRRSG
jgi:tetratricopeptide (TPR) repeat protein